jgi:hypothetical protein
MPASNARNFKLGHYQVAAWVSIGATPLCYAAEGGWSMVRIAQLEEEWLLAP